MNLVFTQKITKDRKTVRLIIENIQDIDEQLLHDQLLPLFYKVTPGLDDETGRLIPGHKIDETLLGPHYLMSDIQEDGLSHTEGISVHSSLLNDLVSELSKLGHTVKSE